MIISPIPPGIWAGSLALVAVIIRQAAKTASRLAHNATYRRAVLRGQRITIDEYSVPVFPEGRLKTLPTDSRHNAISLLSAVLCGIAFAVPLVLKFTWILWNESQPTSKPLI